MPQIKIYKRSVKSSLQDSELSRESNIYKPQFLRTLYVISMKHWYYNVLCLSIAPPEVNDITRIRYNNLYFVSVHTFKSRPVGTAIYASTYKIIIKWQQVLNLIKIPSISLRFFMYGELAPMTVASKHVMYLGVRQRTIRATTATPQHTCEASK
jgi:hypothetical protein